MQLEINHLLFIDDIKLLAKDPTDLNQLLDKTIQSLKLIGLECNKAKSAVNYEVDSVHAEDLGADGTYKYLGIHENRHNQIAKETKEMVKQKILARIDSLCKTKLNARNLMQAINEYAISVLNYYVELHGRRIPGNGPRDKSKAEILPSRYATSEHGKTISSKRSKWKRVG